MFDSENTLKEIEFLDRKEVEVLEWNSMNLSLPPTVYPPREDTQLLYDVLETFEPFGTSKLLEIGSGSGALSIAAAKRGWFVDACDITPTQWLQQNTTLKQQMSALTSLKEA